MSSGLGYPDWQKIQQWLGAPLDQATAAAIGAGAINLGPYNLASWASIILAIKPAGGKVTATVKQKISGGPASLELSEVFNVNAGTTAFEAVVLFGDVVSITLQGDTVGETVDYAIYPSNTTTNAQVLANATINVQQNDALVAAEQTLDFEDAAGWPWTIVDDPTNTRVKVSLPTPGLVKLWDSTEAGVVFPTATITTPTLSQAFKHLLVEIVARSDVAGADTTMYMRLNGDATANYYDSVIDAAGGVVSSASSVAASLGRIARIGAAGGAANEMGRATVRVHDYTGTGRKGWTGYGGGYTSAAFLRIVAGELADLPGAVTTLSFTQAGNFTAGTRITVYGEA